MSPRSVLLTCLLLAAPSAAQAQYQMISPMLYNGPRISLEDHARRNAPPNPEATAPPRAAVPVSPATFDYTVDPRRRRANLAAFVAKTRASDPAAADGLARLFATTDVFQAIQAEVGGYGMKVGNVADAYAIYWMNAWQAVHGSADPDRATIAAVRAQTARALADAGALGAAGDAARQEMAESLWIQAMLVGTADSHAKANPADRRAVAAAVAQGARGMGLDLAAMQLTPRGFVTR